MEVQLWLVRVAEEQDQHQLSQIASTGGAQLKEVTEGIQIHTAHTVLHMAIPAQVGHFRVSVATCPWPHPMDTLEPVRIPAAVACPLL